MKIEIEDLTSVPALQRAGLRERDRAAFAALAAGTADRRRTESDQQHRRPDELHHGGTRAAHARVRSGQAERRHDLGPARARAGERIVALNDEEYELAPSNLVIADAAGPIAIAGVIGGRDSAISDATTSIVLESANFNAASVRKTSAALKLRTDASMRFEKAQDPHNTVRALARAIDLLPLISPGIRLVGGLADRLAKLHHPAPSPARSRLAGAKTGPRARSRRSAAHSREPSIRCQPKTDTGNSWSRCLRGAPPKTSRCRKIWSKKSAA